VRLEIHSKGQGRTGRWLRIAGNPLSPLGGTPQIAASNRRPDNDLRPGIDACDPGLYPAPNACAQRDFRFAVPDDTPIHTNRAIDKAIATHDSCLTIGVEPKLPGQSDSIDAGRNRGREIVPPAPFECDAPFQQQRHWASPQGEARRCFCAGGAQGRADPCRCGNALRDGQICPCPDLRATQRAGRRNASGSITNE
jgi:hypothetical protein